MAAQQVRDRLLRQWLILGQMQAHPRGVTAKQLLDEIDITKPTLYRDLDILRDSVLPIATERVNGEVRYRLDPEAFSLPRPSPLQVLALAIARQLLTSLEGTSVMEVFDEFLKLAPKFDALPFVAGEAELKHDPRHARVLEQAKETKRPVRLRYRSGARVATARLVEPVDWRHIGGHLYVVAWDVAKKAWRTFKVERVQEVELIADRVCVHPPYDPDQVFANSVGIWSAESVLVRIRVSPEKAGLVREYPLGPKPKLIEGAHGSVTVEATVAGLIEAKAWVIRWGRHAEVLAPQELRDLVQEEHEAAASLYRRPNGKPRRRK